MNTYTGETITMPHVQPWVLAIRERIRELQREQERLQSILTPDGMQKRKYTRRAKSTKATKATKGQKQEA